ncbi:condensation domain-containing protein (plasmid) [Streptomyces chartreusis]|uniref:condensation domain-containing protein n=1 Tax=Streptomyces chartreusis TaxID=1969 RepID=UPI002F91426F|nr:condensation domain-containing protein [Streptomyces chartreusis]
MTASFTTDHALTQSQQIVWLHEDLFPDSRAYTFTAALDLWGPLDHDALRSAMRHVIAGHDGLRLRLVPGTYPPRQRVGEPGPPDFEVVDLSTEPEPEAGLENLRDTLHNRPFELARGPLIRWLLVVLGPERHRLLQTEHHLVHDGMSFVITVRDLFSAYADIMGGSTPRPISSRSYVDYLEHPSHTDEDSYARALGYFRSVLDGADFTSPFGSQSSVMRGIAGGQLRTSVPADLASGLRQRAKRDGHTPFTVLMALFGETVKRWTGRSDFTVGTAVGNRPEGFTDCVGMFVNTLPLRLDLRHSRPTGNVLDLLTEQLMDSLLHHQAPIQRLTRDLGRRSSSGLDNPLFSLMFSAHDAKLTELDLGELRVDLVEGVPNGTSRFALDAVVMPDHRRSLTHRDSKPGMLIMWDYQLAFFDCDDIERFAQDHVALLRSYLRHPNAPLAQL